MKSCQVKDLPFKSFEVSKNSFKNLIKKFTTFNLLKGALHYRIVTCYSDANLLYYSKYCKRPFVRML